MANNNNSEQAKTLDIKTARKTIFLDGELNRKKSRIENHHCPYRIVRKWDAEKQKYVKVKVYRTKTTFTRAEMKQRFSPVKGRNIVKTPSVGTKTTQKPVHAKTVNMAPKVTHCFIGVANRKRLDWDQNTLRYQEAA